MGFLTLILSKYFIVSFQTHLAGGYYTWEMVTGLANAYIFLASRALLVFCICYNLLSIKIQIKLVSGWSFHCKGLCLYGCCSGSRLRPARWILRYCWWRRWPVPRTISTWCPSCSRLKLGVVPTPLSSPWSWGPEAQPLSVSAGE